MESAKLTGHVKVFKVWEDGEKEKIHDQDNIVVASGMNLALDLLGGIGSPVGIEYLAVGTGDPTGGTTAAATGNTALQVEVFRKTVGSASRTGQTLTITTTLDTSEANNNSLVEAGLYGNGASDTVDSGTLIARIVHDATSKTSGFSLQYEWTLSLVNV